MININIILTILIFSLLIIVHELGHFATAKWSGVQVNEFWLGMGPTIYSKHYKGTDYKIKALPFGGAVVMEGEDENSDSEYSFKNAKKINKAIIMFAGAFMNFVFGFVVVCVLMSSVKQITLTQIESFPEGFLYENIFEINDEIVSIDGHKILVDSDISYALSTAKDEYFDFVLLRDGEKITVKNQEFKPALYETNGVEQLRYGLNFAVKDANFLDKIELSAKTCINYARLTWLGVIDLVTGNVSVNEMSGPVGITSMIGEAADVSQSAMWGFVAFISINLGVMNLLPFPALDGGRLLLLFVETIRRKPLKPEIEGYIHGVGIIILLGFMLYVTFHDIFVKILGF